MLRRINFPGLLVVIALHSTLLYLLWHASILPTPTEAATLFVSLLNDPPKQAPPKPEPPKPKPQPVNLNKPVEPDPPPLLAAQAPVVTPDEPVAPPPIEAPAEPPAPAAPPKPLGPVVLNEELSVSCPDQTLPAYPSISRRLGEDGKVVLRVELDESGRVDRVSIKSSSGYARLDEAARSAVMQWRCHPAKREGIAVRVVAIQPFNFTLEGK